MNLSGTPAQAHDAAIPRSFISAAISSPTPPASAFSSAVTMVLCEAKTGRSPSMSSGFIKRRSTTVGTASRFAISSAASSISGTVLPTPMRQIAEPSRRTSHFPHSAGAAPVSRASESGALPRG